MELAAASEMSLGYRVDKHTIWHARYLVAVDCRPAVPGPRSADRLLPASLRRIAGQVYAWADDPYSPARKDTPLPAFE